MHDKLAGVSVAGMDPIDAVHLEFNKTLHLKSQIISKWIEILSSTLLQIDWYKYLKIGTNTWRERIIENTNT